MDVVRNHEFSLSHLQKVERGVLDPRLSTLKKLADAYGVTLAELLEGV
jgi:transcriptional regulator with XRE-family HTH domain